MHTFDKFEYLCRKKGVKESEAYKAMGINKGTISLWRTARDNNEPVVPSTKNAVKLSEYFGCPTDYFLCDNEEEQKNKPATTEGSELREDQKKASDMILQMTHEQLKAFIAAAEAFLK